MERRRILARLAELHREIADLLEQLARMDDPARSSGGSVPDETGAEREDTEIRDRALTCLRELGVSVLGITEPAAVDERLIRIARPMAAKYLHLTDLLRAVRRAQANGSTVRLDLGGQRQQVIADVTLICDLAYKAGLLAAYDYRRAPACRLTCRPSRSPLAIWFFGGGWLELHVRHVLLELLRTRGGDDWGAVFGAHVRLPDGDEFELDAFAVVGDVRFWIEAKSGQEFPLEKYARIRRHLCRPSDHALLVWADYRQQDPIAGVRGALADMELLGLDTLLPRLRELLEVAGRPKHAAVDGT